MICKELETVLHNTFVSARRSRHEFITVEHLLLALLDDSSAKAVLNTCGANAETLRSKLTQHIAHNAPATTMEKEVYTQPTMGSQRVIQKAILQAQATGRKEVTGADVLIAICRERDSHAVYFLGQDGIDLFKVVKATPTTARELLDGEPKSQRAAQNEIDSEETRQIILLHDKATPADFVLRVLKDFLLLDDADATEVLEQARQHGKAVCGLFPRETAEFVLQQIAAYARKHGYAVHCVAAAQW